MASVCIFRILMRLWKIREQIFDGLKTQAFGRDFGGKRMVHELDCMVQRTNLAVFRSVPLADKVSVSYSPQY